MCAAHCTSPQHLAMLRHAPRLRALKLDLAANDVGDVGARALETLRDHPVLTALSLNVRDVYPQQDSDDGSGSDQCSCDGSDSSRPPLECGSDADSDPGMLSSSGGYGGRDGADGPRMGPDRAALACASDGTSDDESMPGLESASDSESMPRLESASDSDDVWDDSDPEMPALLSLSSTDDEAGDDHVPGPRIPRRASAVAGAAHSPISPRPVAVWGASGDDDDARPGPVFTGDCGLGSPGSDDQDMPPVGEASGGEDGESAGSCAGR